MKPLFTLLFLASLLQLSCKKKSSTFIPPNDCGTKIPYTVLSAPADTAGPTVQPDSFPLVVGHQWTYKLQEQAWDACGQMYFDTVVYRVTVISDTFIHGIRFALMQSTYNKTTNADTGWFYIPSTFFCYPLPSYYFVNFSNGLHQLDGLGNTDSSYIADSTGHLTATSSFVSSWNSAEHVSSSDVVEQRAWAGYVTVTTPAGTFNCRKVNVSDTNNNYEKNGLFTFSTSQYFSAKGLAREVQTGEGTATGPGHGPTYITRVITLTAVNF